MACPLSTQQYCTALIIPSAGKKDEEGKKKKGKKLGLRCSVKFLLKEISTTSRARSLSLSFPALFPSPSLSSTFCVNIRRNALTYNITLPSSSPDPFKTAVDVVSLNSDDPRDEIGNFQSAVFQVLAQEKYKRIRKLEKLVDKKKGDDRKRRVEEQRTRAVEKAAKKATVSNDDEEPPLPGGKRKQVRFDQSSPDYHYEAPANVFPDSTIAACLEDPEFKKDRANSRVITDARAEIRENEMEQTRRHAQPLEYGMVIQLWHRQHRQFLRVSPSTNSKLDPANMRVELHPTTSVESFWRIMPTFKIRSIGDLVRAQDEVVLERSTSRGQYIGVSNTSLRSAVTSFSEDDHDDSEDEPKAFCCAGVHEVSASVKKASFVLGKYKGNEEVQRVRTPGLGSIEQCLQFQAPEADVVAVAPPICAGDVIQLFHKDSDCWVSAEGVFRDPLAGGTDATTSVSKDAVLAEDVHLRHRMPMAGKLNKLDPPTSAVSFFQIEQADVYEGGKIGWATKVRFRHLTSQLYLAVGAENKKSDVDDSVPKWSTRLIANGTTTDSIFFVHPVIQDTPHVPSDAYIRIQHFNKSWLHASNIKRVRGGGSEGGDFDGFGAD